MKEYLYTQRVYVADTDAGGIVYHASDIAWAEHARTEMLREAVPQKPQSGLAADDGILTVIKSISIHYRRPARLDDEIEVITRMDEIRHFSCMIKQRIVRDGELLADLDVKAAFIDRATKRPVQIPEEFVRALEEKE